MDVPPAIVALALHPFRDLPPAPGTELIERDGILLAFHPYPIAQPVEPLALTAEDVPVAVAAARVAARERGKRVLAWWIAPEHDHLRAALEEEELVNEDTPGFEAVENAMYSQPGNPRRQYLAKIGTRSSAQPAPASVTPGSTCSAARFSPMPARAASTARSQ
jgi:hypothetical protein